MYGFIIFDVDGTLIDTHKATLLALNKVLVEETGKEYSLKELEFVIGIPGEVSLPALGIKDIEYTNRKWNVYLKEYSSQIKVYPGIKDVFLRLKNDGIKTGLVTSNTRYELEGLLHYFYPFRLMEYVDFAVCADDTIRHKPFPDPILKYLELSGARVERAMYIGDTLYDMQCAESANVDFGLAAWGIKRDVWRKMEQRQIYDTAKHMEPKFIFNTPLDILNLPIIPKAKEGSIV